MLDCAMLPKRKRKAGSPGLHRTCAAAQCPACGKLLLGWWMLSRAFRSVWPALLALTLVVAAPAQQPKLNPALPLIHSDNGPNSSAAQKAHYVVLVSLDGFRWDYAVRDGARHLLALGKEGVWAPNGMLPSYPSLTFPNH